MTTPQNHNPQTDEDAVIHMFEVLFYVLGLFALAAVAVALWFRR